MTIANLFSLFLLASSKLQPKQSTVFELSRITEPLDSFLTVPDTAPPVKAPSSASSALRAILDIVSFASIFRFSLAFITTNDLGGNATSASFSDICMPCTETLTFLPLALTTVASLPLKAPFLQITNVSPSLRSGLFLISDIGTISANCSSASAAACCFFLKTLGTFSASVNASRRTYLISSQLLAIIFFDGSDFNFSKTSSRTRSFSSNFFANFAASSLRAFNCSLSSFCCCFFISCSNCSNSFFLFSSSITCSSMSAF
mmetsp:Transcript_20773/g.30704  ORF Transcript_20773/g.30704 Transcript_20773/m.30704 type:complete len:260 (-) Transcript_20773:187-966(-)